MIDINLLVIFFLVFTRVSVFMVTAPFFSYHNIPSLVKIGFSFFLAAVVFPQLAGAGVSFPGGFWGYGLAVLSEAGVGLMLGLVANIIFSAVRMAGQFLDFQMGFAMSAIFDPLGEMQSTLVSRFINLLGLIFFLNMNGHYYLITGLINSYDLVPLTAAALQAGMALSGIRAFAVAFALALQLCIPVMAVMLITDLALGFVSKTVPQLNVFMMAFPLKIVVGLLALSAVIPLLGILLQQVFETMQKYMLLLLRGLT